MSSALAAAQREAEEEERKVIAAKARLERFTRGQKSPPAGESVGGGAGRTSLLLAADEQAGEVRVLGSEREAAANAALEKATAGNWAAEERTAAAKAAAAQAVAAARAAVEAAVAEGSSGVVRTEVSQSTTPAVVAAPTEALPLQMGVPATMATERAEMWSGTDQMQTYLESAKRIAQVTASDVSEAWVRHSPTLQAYLMEFAKWLEQCTRDMMVGLPRLTDKCLAAAASEEVATPSSKPLEKAPAATVSSTGVNSYKAQPTSPWGGGGLLDLLMCGCNMPRKKAPTSAF